MIQRDVFVFGALVWVTGFWGVLVLPDDIKQKLQTTPILGEPPPWWLFLLLSLALFGGMVELARRGLLKPWLKSLSNSEEPQSATPNDKKPEAAKSSTEGQRIAKLQKEITENKREYDKKVVGWRQEIASAKNALEEEKQKSAQAEREHGATKKQLRLAELQVNNLSHQIRYGITESRVFPPLDDLALVVANNEMQKTRDVMDVAAGGLLDLAYNLIEDMEGGDERNQVLSVFFKDRYFHPTANLFARLCEELDLAEANNERVDFREWLMHYYVAYCQLRRIVGQMVRFRETKLSEFEVYPNWKAADQEFLTKIKNISVMHNAIKEVNARYGHPVALSD